MKLSALFQKTAFKIALSCILFAVFVLLITKIVYLPYAHPFSGGNDYNMAFTGASVFTRGIDPRIIDEKTGANSYVLASKGAPLSGRYEMLKAALEVQDLETVVIEISYYTLIKRIRDYSQEERLLYFPKVIGAGNKLQTALRRFSFMDDEYDMLYGQTVLEGFQVWFQDIFTGQYQSYLERKGFSPYKANDMHLETAEEIAGAYNSNELDLWFPEDVIAELESMVQLCLDQNVRVVLLTMPMTQRFVWESTGLDTYRDIICSIADQYQVSYYDFNLLENIGSYLDDSYSWHDEEHLSKYGAADFSPILGEVLAGWMSGTDLPYRFYDSYEEAKEHSVYMIQ